MNHIQNVPFGYSASCASDQGSTGMLQLKDRALQLQQGSIGGDARPQSEVLDGEEGELAVRKWAKQIFVEKIFFGEEEESGIPPLSMEI